MLMPQPAFLRRLLDEYELLRVEDPSAAAPGQRLRDLEYTLCVDGTRKIEDALDMARAYLTASASQTQPAGEASRAVTATAAGRWPVGPG
ncbi:hypothetical protein JCM4814A_02420 [Streptomyces phaeofaciens JCM 4814]|uniref:DUF5133 domain-containing protein n=1 Tax=Streptomyces phaeofaciens TaxID=68254 RepID=A0A918HQH4_9ACTN|nr:DUF5133 domain-containing protein [Streptomyces phaeofaciens]GGT93166.1 hypothetical protein GCM10010226_83810 [Streptomyces phaeofaciens]